MKRPVAVAVVCSMFMSSLAWAGGAPGISVNLVSCISPNTHAKVVATVPDDAVSGRVYFRGTATGGEYYVDMRRGGGSMWAFLPAPSASTRSVQYRVVTRDARGTEMSSNPVSIQTRTYCPAVTYGAAELDAMKNIVLGLTTASQSAIPDGFECQNVVRYITVAGEMRVNDYCRNLLAGLPPSGAPAVATAPTTAAPTVATGTGSTAATTGATTATTAGTTGATTGATVGAGGGLSTGTILALTAAGLLAAGVIIQQNQDDDDEENSPSRP